MRGKRTRRGLALIIFLTAGLSTSCASVTSETSCAAFAVITVSKDDVLTDQTARQVLKHNRAYEALCR